MIACWVNYAFHINNIIGWTNYIIWKNNFLLIVLGGHLCVSVCMSVFHSVIFSHNNSVTVWKLLVPTLATMLWFLSDSTLYLWILKNIPYFSHAQNLTCFKIMVILFIVQKINGKTLWVLSDMNAICIYTYLRWGINIHRNGSFKLTRPYFMFSNNKLCFCLG